MAEKRGFTVESVDQVRERLGVLSARRENGAPQSERFALPG
jgi:hypothetical protein